MKFGSEKLKKVLLRLTPIVLVFVLAIGLLTGGNVSAYESLEGIEQIKDSGESFNILEIVASQGEGSLGYYIPNAEPSQSELDALSAGVSFAERKSAYDTLMTELRTNGMLSDGVGTPLTAVASEYMERFAWEEREADAYELTLDVAETVEYRGEMTEVEEGVDGAFTFDEVSGVYSYVATGGTHNFRVDDNFDEVTISYSSVYIRPAYRNNDWFRQGVFDLPAYSSFDVSLVTVTASDLTSEQLNSADLVVMPWSAAYAEENKDLSADMGTAIVTLGTPKLVDKRLAGISDTAPNISSVASGLMGSGGFEGGYVNGNVYVFMPDALRTELSTNMFMQVFEPDMYMAEGTAYHAVYEEIAWENERRDLAAIGRSQEIPVVVSMATVLRYVINMGEVVPEVLKTEIRVLEIGSSSLSADFIRTNYLPTAASGMAVTIESVSAGELSARERDIGEDYDMVFIGGSSYSGIGATVSSTIPMLMGLLDSDYDGAGNLLSGPKTYRLSGNDISVEKAEELVEFSLSGFPIIVSNDLMVGDVIQPAVDINSHMYDALSGALNVGADNVMSEAEAISNKDTVLRYLNLQNPIIEVAEGTQTLPPPYGSVTDKNALAADADLNFTITIRNPTQVLPDLAIYEARVYVDYDGDGMFEGGEILPDVVVSPTSSSGYISAGVLQQDVQYRISAHLPEDYFGVVAWKLEVSKQGATHIKSSIDGVSFREATEGESTAIVGSVLQIVPDDWTLSSYIVNVLDDDYFTPLGNANMYNIALETKKVSEFGTSADLSGYTMLILCTDDLNKTLSESVAKFIMSGKSVIFTADAVGTGQLFNVYLRDLAGMDRYGVTNAQYGVTQYSPYYTDVKPEGAGNYVASGYDGADASHLQMIAQAGYEIAYEPNAEGVTTGETQGYTDGKLSTTSGVTSVKRQNSGQFTTFPYNLGMAEQAVSRANIASYQLNISGDDTLVWYTLGDSGDALNEYYAYSKGNVMYVGTSFENVGVMTTFEEMLMVNAVVFGTSRAVKPELMVTDYSGGRAEYLYLPTVFDDTADTQGNVLDTETALRASGRELLFRVLNVAGAGEKTVNLYYEAVDGIGTHYYDEYADVMLLVGGTTPSDAKRYYMVEYYSEGNSGQLYWADGDNRWYVPSSEDIVSGRAYAIYLSTEILQYFEDYAGNEISVYMELQSDGAGGEQSGLSGELILRKLGLMPLS